MAPEKGGKKVGPPLFYLSNQPHDFLLTLSRLSVLEPYPRTHRRRRQPIWRVISSSTARLVESRWSLRQRPKPLQRTDADPVVALHPGQRRLLASRLVERPQRKLCRLPIVSCNPCATVLGRDLLNNSISPNQATQTETQTRLHRGNDAFDQGLWRLKRSGIIRREPIFS